MVKELVILAVNFLCGTSFQSFDCAKNHLEKQDKQIKERCFELIDIFQNIQSKTIQMVKSAIAIEKNRTILK